jgi:threonine/homoserine/homoserine lactone efflux protein
MATTFLAFLTVSIIVIVTPGPDTAMTIRNTLLGGRGGGVATALGVATGQAVWALAASLGIAALLIASEPLFLAVKLVGAVYLVLLGLQALVAAFRASRPGAEVVEIALPRRLHPFAAYRQGLVSNLGNPKMAVFFTSLLPQFTPGSDPTFAALFLLGLIFCGLTFLWLAGYAAVVAKAGDFLRKPRMRAALESITGVVLIALGLRLAAESR